jgi:hypothetical protein
MKKSKKSLQKLQIAALLAVASGSVFFSGCATVAVAGAAGTVAYMRGDLTASFDKTVAQLSTAIEAAGKELGLNQISATSDATTSMHTFRNAQDKKIVIKTEKKGDNVTEVSVRVGTVGDKDMSNMIMDKIKKNLG